METFHPDGLVIPVFVMVVPLLPTPTLLLHVIDLGTPLLGPADFLPAELRSPTLGFVLNGGGR